MRTNRAGRISKPPPSATRSPLRVCLVSFANLLANRARHKRSSRRAELILGDIQIWRFAQRQSIEDEAVQGHPSWAPSQRVSEENRHHQLSLLSFMRARNLQALSGHLSSNAAVHFQPMFQRLRSSSSTEAPRRLRMRGL